ncbi:MAG: hypothetical protein ABIA37_00680 [Candidatus Woesearchaeota archaeon]
MLVAYFEEDEQGELEYKLADFYDQVKKRGLKEEQVLKELPSIKAIMHYDLIKPDSNSSFYELLSRHITGCGFRDEYCLGPEIDFYQLNGVRDYSGKGFLAIIGGTSVYDENGEEIEEEYGFSNEYFDDLLES